MTIIIEILGLRPFPETHVTVVVILSLAVLEVVLVLSKHVVIVNLAKGRKFSAFSELSP